MYSQLTQHPQDSFLSALFRADDVLLLRFVETWTEGGRKKGRTTKTAHCTVADLLDRQKWDALAKIAEATNANQFFGVCPRFKDAPGFDLAAQIRTVRVLWADIDHCTPERAKTKCAEAGLPPPSIVVNSGNGVHLYWLLTEPYLIDDAPDPTAVFKRKGEDRYYILEPLTGDEVDVQKPEVSPKGRWLEEVVKGIASRIGGDSTQDLSRLLRLPGTLNRKDARNGQKPVLCTLVECDASRRYPLSDFAALRIQSEPLAVACTSAKKTTSLSGPDQARWQALLDNCAGAQIGDDRSKVDWALCRFAVDHGLDQEDVWQAVRGVSKFLERGKDYFNRTWTKAKQAKPSGKKSNVLRLLDLAVRECDLFTTSDRVPHVTVTLNGRKETQKVRSTAFRQWLAARGEQNGIVPSAKVIGDAVLCLEARACRGRRSEVYLRFARVNDVLYLDLANDEGEVAVVSRDGWNVTTDCPVAFIRPANMAALPRPERGGDLDDLRRFINVTDADFPLLRGFLLDCLKGVGPYTVLLINGEQGSAKSTGSKYLRSLLDPVHKATARRLQRDEYELAIAAQMNALLVFDNVSTLPQWLSDAIASLATGSGFAVRTLYSQDDETVYGTARPVCFNGIPDFAESSDLLDRAIKVTLPPIPKERRKSEDQLEPMFEAARPKLLGALLDAASAGLRNYAAMKPDELPRMAFSARWIAACEAGMPGHEGEFLAAYERNCEETTALAIDHSTVATGLLTWMETWRAARWEGSASELLGILSNTVQGIVLMGNAFPKLPNRLSSELRRIAPALRQVGVTIKLTRSKRCSRIIIERAGASEAKRAPDGLPPLSVVTEGKIPYDLPYERREFPNGSASLAFRPLTNYELARLDANTQSQLAQREGKMVWSIHPGRRRAG